MEIKLSSGLLLAHSACEGIIFTCALGREKDIDSVYETLEAIKEVIEYFESIEPDEDTLMSIKILKDSYKNALDAVSQGYGKRNSLN